MDAVSKVLHFVERTFAFIAIGVLFVAIVLLEMHILKDEHILLGLSGIIWLGIARLVLVTKRSSDQAVQQIKELRAQLKPQLYSLEDCLRDISARLRNVNRTQRVVIRHLGLDMVQAWEKIERLLKEHPNISQVDYEVLMLSGDVRSLKPVPDDVKVWAEHANDSLKAIKAGLTRVGSTLNADGKTMHLRLRRYATVPVIHGLHLAEPNGIAVYYICFCRWDHPQYVWGDGKYIKVIAADTHLDPLANDLREIFDSYYKALWAEAHTEVINENIGARSTTRV